MTNGNAPDRGDIAQLGGAVAAVAAVLTSVAVTGVLGQAQRNHGVWLLAAFACVLAGAVLWLFGASVETTRPAGPAIGPVRVWLIQRARSLKLALKGLGLIAVATGLGLAIYALIITQQDSERPTVSATFDAAKGILKANVTAAGLGKNDRMTIRIDGLKDAGRQEFDYADPQRRPLYFALLGPDPDGKVSYQAEVFVPRQLRIVGVSAWTAKNQPSCVDGTAPEQSMEPGCVAVRLRAR